jgi:carboxymethylenebutenolidase
VVTRGEDERFEVEIAAADGVAHAYLARGSDGPHPGVLFVMDAYGLRPTIHEMVDRIAGEGYTVLAPDVFYRSPLPPLPDLNDAEDRARFFGALRPLLEELTPRRLAADGAAYLDHLADAGAPGRVAITGYCMGGRLGWRIAAAHPERVAALAGFHPGGLATDAPDSPHHSANDLLADVYLAFADDDPSMTAEQIATVERALGEAGVRYRAEVYEGARHGYTMADGPAFDEAARERHFRELHDLLARTL